jgi:hypothetical protein
MVRRCRRRARREKVAADVGHRRFANMLCGRADPPNPAHLLPGLNGSGAAGPGCRRRCRCTMSAAFRRSSLPQHYVAETSCRGITDASTTRGPEIPHPQLWIDVAWVIGVPSQRCRPVVSCRAASRFHLPGLSRRSTRFLLPFSRAGFEAAAGAQRRSADNRRLTDGIGSVILAGWRSAHVRRSQSDGGMSRGPK